ncbi:MAG TPA: phospholipase [Bacteroidales bacterium]|nr:phospholipase [Bacteroidales bacterium]
MTFKELVDIKRRNPSHRIGFALSGGGIKGLCHAGAIRALEEIGIRPDVISGVSAGSVVGALYADGRTPEQIADMFMNITFRSSTLYDRAGGGFLNIKPFLKLVHSNLTSRRIEELQIPLHIVATDLDHGKSVVFTRGNLLQSVAASCSVPVLFTPTIIDGVHYVDGGVFKNFPATTIRDYCDTLIGINASPMMAEKYKINVANVLERVYHFMFKANIVHDREVCDILLEPEAMGMYDTFDVEKSQEIYDLGYNYTKSFFDE